MPEQVQQHEGRAADLVGVEAEAAEMVFLLSSELSAACMLGPCWTHCTYLPQGRRSDAPPLPSKDGQAKGCVSYPWADMLLLTLSAVLCA